MKKTIAGFVIVLMAALLVMSACGGDSSIAGNWGDDRGTRLTLRDDGTGIWLGGASIIWSAEEDILTVTTQEGTEEQFRFHVTRGRLRLYFLNGVPFDNFIRLW